MKIYFIGQKGIPARGGGIERYADDLAVHLAGQGHEIFVYTRPYYTSRSRKNHQGVKLLSLPSLRTKHLDAISHSLLASLDVLRRDADIIYYQNIGPSLVSWIPKLFSRAKIVSILQSPDYDHKKWGRFARFSLRLGERIMCRVSDQLITVNKSLKDHIRTKYGREAHLIPNGAVINRRVRPVEISKRWGLEENNYIFSASRLVRHKGINYLIEAYNRLETDKKLVIAGEGAFTDSYVAELKRLASGNPNIIFTGNQSGRILAELYSNAYLFVQPSESEGLSLALLEAMAYGRGILVSDIQENRETIDRAGLIFKSKSSKDLEEKLAYLLKHPELIEEKGKEARARVKKYYNWNIIARDILKVFAEAWQGEKKTPLVDYHKMVRRFISLIF